MTHTTKGILKRSINDFLAAKINEQDEMIHNVKEKLKQHESSLKSIGFGYSDDYVEAGKIFLRIFEIKQIDL